MEISGKGLLHFDEETLSLISNQTYHKTNMFSPYQPNSSYESNYECRCIMINGKTCSVPLNILSSVGSAFVLVRALGFLRLNLTCPMDTRAIVYKALFWPRFRVSKDCFDSLSDRRSDDVQPESYWCSGISAVQSCRE